MDEIERDLPELALPADGDPKKARRDFSRLSFALLVFLVAASLLQVLYSILGSRVSFPQGSWFYWVVGYIVPIYAVGVPLALLVMRRVPAVRAERRSLSLGSFLVFLLMCFPIMYGGNLIGTILSSMFSGGAAQNPLEGMVSKPGVLQIVVLAVLAPLFEEFIFRRQLIDRAGRYGEKTAILFSSLTFGLFHGNLYQFFYAFGLGMLFAYIYTRTRKLRYTVALHMIINFLGSVVGPWIVSKAALSSEMLEAAAQDPASADLGGMALVSLYGFAILGLSIAGLVLLIRRRRRFVFQRAEEELPNGSGPRAAIFNLGFLLFALTCLAVFVFALFGRGLLG
ncbi:MAG: CPBP family intramembrane metalloprotease [Oscillospiraceae bacterium]|nr:CPBP family intramembrane metalloprotease [Oscillospiraceae bacterium]